MKRRWVVIGMIVLAVASGWWWKKRPQTGQEETWQMQKVMVGQWAVMVQNRLAWVALAKLETDAADFVDKNDELMSQVVQTNKQGQEGLRELPRVPSFEERERLVKLLEDSRQ